MNCRAIHESSTSAADILLHEQQETMTSFVRRAIRVVKSSDAPTLQEAIITADELAEFLASREEPMEISSLQPLVLEQFLHDSQSQIRAVNAVNWLNKNLQLGWPLDEEEKPRGNEAVLARSTTGSCFCCGKLARPQCLIDDCNRAILAGCLTGKPAGSDLMQQGATQNTTENGCGTGDHCARGVTHRFIRFMQRFIHYRNQESTQQLAPAPSTASPISEDSQAKPENTHAEGKQSEASTGTCYQTRHCWRSSVYKHSLSYAPLTQWQIWHALAR